MNRARLFAGAVAHPNPSEIRVRTAADARARTAPTAATTFDEFGRSIWDAPAHVSYIVTAATAAAIIGRRSRR